MSLWWLSIQASIWSQAKTSFYCDPTTVTAAKIVIIDKCADIQSYTIM
jgi:hypothetical protein